MTAAYRCPSLILLSVPPLLPSLPHRYLDGQPRYQLVSGQGTGAGWFTTTKNSGPNAPFDRLFYLGFALSAGGVTAGNHNLAQLRASVGSGKAFQIDYVKVWGRK